MPASPDRSDTSPTTPPAAAPWSTPTASRDLDSEFGPGTCWMRQIPEGDAMARPLPPLTWEAVPGAHAGFTRPAVLGWGVEPDGTLTLVAPYLPPHYDLPGLIRGSIERLLDTLLTVARHPGANWTRPALIAAGALRDDTPPDHTGESLEEGRAREALLARIVAALDQATVRAANGVPGGVARWYGPLLFRPDLRELLDEYPLAWGFFVDDPDRVTDPSTGVFPRRLAGTQVVALAANRGRREAPLSPGALAWLRGPTNPAERERLIAYLSLEEHGATEETALWLSDRITPDLVRRLTQARDWVALLALSHDRGGGALPEIFLADPAAFWRWASSLGAPLPQLDENGQLDMRYYDDQYDEYEESTWHVPVRFLPSWDGVGDVTLPAGDGSYWVSADPEADLAHWAAVAQRVRIYWDEATREAEFKAPLTAARSPRRLAALLERFRRSTVTRQRALRERIAAHYPDPYPRPAWVPDTGVITTDQTVEVPLSLIWLGTPDDVLAEGLTMEHCLGLTSHHDDATNGLSAFFRVAGGDAEASESATVRATCEVETATGRVKQAYGMRDVDLPRVVHASIRQAIEAAMAHAVHVNSHAEQRERAGRSPRAPQ